MSDDRKRHERREFPTRLEQHLRQRFEPWTDFAHSLIERCRESMSRGVDVVDVLLFDNWCAELEQLGADEQERLVTLRLLFRRGLIQLEQQQVRMNPMVEWSKDYEKEVIIEAIKLRPLNEVDIPTALHVSHLCRRMLTGQESISLRLLSSSTTIDPVQLLHALNLLDLAGVVTFDSSADQPVVFVGNALQQNDRSLELLLFSVLALRNGRHVRGVTEGWNRVLVSNEFIAQTLNTASRNETRKPDVRGYAGAGYLSSATAKGEWHPPEFYFFSLNPRDGQRFRASSEYEQWRMNHRMGEDAVRSGIQDAWEQSRLIESLPPEIHLISFFDLEQILATHGSTLKTASLYGYVCPAADRDDTIVFRKKGEKGKQARHYFIARHRKELQEWEHSEGFTQWREQRRLLAELLREWSTKVLETMPPVASFVDAQYQPAYVVERSVVTDASDGLFTVSHLCQLGHIAAAQRMMLEKTVLQGDPEFFLFWPVAAKGQAYKKSLLERLKKPGKVLEHNNHQLVHWRVQQLSRSADWPVHPDTLPVPPWYRVRLISYDDVATRLRGLEPLTVSGLVRRGYLIHAQTSRTRSGVGYFIFCPEGKQQAVEVAGSPWYTKVQQIQRNRGFSNLVRSPR